MSYVADAVGTFKHAFFLEIKKRSLLSLLIYLPPFLVNVCFQPLSDNFWNDCYEILPINYLSYGLSLLENTQPECNTPGESWGGVGRYGNSKGVVCPGWEGVGLTPEPDLPVDKTTYSMWNNPQFILPQGFCSHTSSQ